jgi:hypothetical protein
MKKFKIISTLLLKTLTVANSGLIDVQAKPIMNVKMPIMRLCLWGK